MQRICFGVIMNLANELVPVILNIDEVKKAWLL